MKNWGTRIRTYKDGGVSDVKTNSYDGGEENLSLCLSLLSENHPDLSEIVASWGTLPPHIKAAIQTLVRSSLASDEK